MQHRTIAHTTVSAIGLGAMPLSIEHRPDETQAIATVHAALDAGVTRPAAVPAGARRPLPSTVQPHMNGVN